MTDPPTSPPPQPEAPPRRPEFLILADPQEAEDGNACVLAVREIIGMELGFIGYSEAVARRSDTSPLGYTLTLELAELRWVEGEDYPAAIRNTFQAWKDEDKDEGKARLARLRAAERHLATVEAVEAVAQADRARWEADRAREIAMARLTAARNAEVAGT